MDPGHLVQDASSLESLVRTSEIEVRHHTCGYSAAAGWMHMAACVVCWPLAIYSWYRYRTRSFSDVQWELRTCTV